MEKTYTYEQLKKAAAEARAELCSRGTPVRKTARRKPRDPAKEALLYARALNRLDQFPPRREGESIILPYFS